MSILVPDVMSNKHPPNAFNASFVLMHFMPVAWQLVPQLTVILFTVADSSCCCQLIRINSPSVRKRT